MRRFIGVGLGVLRILRDYSARTVAMEEVLLASARRNASLVRREAAADRFALIESIRWDKRAGLSRGFHGRPRTLLLQAGLDRDRVLPDVQAPLFDDPKRLAVGGAGREGTGRPVELDGAP